MHWYVIVPPRLHVVTHTYVHTYTHTYRIRFSALTVYVNIRTYMHTQGSRVRLPLPPRRLEHGVNYTAHNMSLQSNRRHRGCSAGHIQGGFEHTQTVRKLSQEKQHIVFCHRHVARACSQPETGEEKSGQRNEKCRCRQ
jgi:hypothetical protein